MSMYCFLFIFFFFDFTKNVRIYYNITCRDRCSIEYDNVLYPAIPTSPISGYLPVNDGEMVKIKIVNDHTSSVSTQNEDKCQFTGGKICIEGFNIYFTTLFKDFWDTGNLGHYIIQDDILTIDCNYPLKMNINLNALNASDNFINRTTQFACTNIDKLNVHKNDIIQFSLQNLIFFIIPHYQKILQKQ